MTTSCIIPAYNAERYLAQAVQSLQRQTRSLSEIVIVDDGSEDGTLSLAQQLALQDPRLKVIPQANQGNTAARNRGVEACSGDILSFLDADDLWLPDRLEHALHAFEHDPALDYLVGYARPYFDWLPDVPQEVRQRSQQDPRNQCDTPAFIGAGLVARRSAWLRVGPFDANRSHASGMDWFLRARSLGLREAVVPQALYLRRIHGDNVSLQSSAASQHQFARTLRDHILRTKK